MNFRNRKTTLLLPLLLLGLFGIFNDSGAFARDEGSGGLLPFFKRNAEKKNRAEQLFERGREAERKQDWVTASAAYRQCFDEYNDKTPPATRGAALHRLAVSKARLRQYDESEHLFREALPLVGENAEFACDFGQMFYDQGRYVDCEEVLTSARKFANDDPRLNYRLGYAIAMQKDRQIEGARYLKRSLGEAEGFEELAKIFDGMDEEAKADLARQKAKDARARQTGTTTPHSVSQSVAPQNSTAQSPIVPNLAAQNPMPKNPMAQNSALQNPFPASESFPDQGIPSFSAKDASLAQQPQSPQLQQRSYSSQVVIPHGTPLASSPEILSANPPSTLPNHAASNSPAENTAPGENMVLPRRYSPLSQGVTVSPSPKPETTDPASSPRPEFPFSETSQAVNTPTAAPSNIKPSESPAEPKVLAKESAFPQISHLAEVPAVPSSDPSEKSLDAVSSEIAIPSKAEDTVTAAISETSATPTIAAPTSTPTITRTLPLPKDVASIEHPITNELAVESTAVAEEMFPLMPMSNPESGPASFAELPPSPFAEPVPTSVNTFPETASANVPVVQTPIKTESLPEHVVSQTIAENVPASTAPERNPSSPSPAIAFQSTLQTTIPLGSTGTPQNSPWNANSAQNAQSASTIQNEQNIAGGVLPPGVSEPLPISTSDSAKPYAPYEHPGARDEAASERNTASQDHNPLRSGQITSREPRKNATAFRDDTPTKSERTFEETTSFANRPNTASHGISQVPQSPTFSPDTNSPTNVSSNSARDEHTERRVERISPGASGEAALSFATSDTRFTEESPARTSTSPLAWNLPSDTRSNESRDIPASASDSTRSFRSNAPQSASRQSEMPESRTGDPLVQFPKFEPVRDPALPQSTPDSLSRSNAPYPSVVSRKQTDHIRQESPRQNTRSPSYQADSRSHASQNAPLREPSDGVPASSLIQTDLTRNDPTLAQNRRAPTPGMVSLEAPLPGSSSAPHPASASSESRPRYSDSVAAAAPKEGARFQGPARNTTAFSTESKSKTPKHSWHDIPTEFDEPAQKPTDNALMQPLLLAGQETPGVSRVPQAPGPEGIAPDPLLAARSQAIPVEPEPKPILREAFPILPTPSTLATHPGNETDKTSFPLSENEPTANELATNKPATGEPAADKPTVSEPATLLAENTPKTPAPKALLAEAKADAPSTRAPASDSGNSALHIPTELAGVTPAERRPRTNDGTANPTETKRSDNLVKPESATLHAQNSTRAPQPPSLFEPQNTRSAQAPEPAPVASHSPTRTHALTYTPTHQPTETPSPAELRTESPLLALAPTQEKTTPPQSDKARQSGGTETNNASQAFFRPPTPPNRHAETVPGEELREIPASNESRLPVLLWDSQQLADASDDNRSHNGDRSNMQRTITARTEPMSAPLTQVVPTPSQSVATSSTKNPQTTALPRLPVLIPRESEESGAETLATTGPAPKPVPASTPAPLVVKTPSTRQMPERHTPEAQTEKPSARPRETIAASQRKAPAPEPAETIADSRKNVQELPGRTEVREDTTPAIVVPPTQSLATHSPAPADIVKPEKPNPPKRTNAGTPAPAAPTVAVKPPVSKPLSPIAEPGRTGRTDELLFPKLAKAPIPQATDKDDGSNKVRIRPLGAMDMSQAGFSSTARWNSGSDSGETEAPSAREADGNNTDDADSGRLFPRRRLLRNLVNSRNNNESVGRDAIVYNAFESNGTSHGKTNTSNKPSNGASGSTSNTSTNTSGGASVGNVPNRPDDSASKRSAEYRTEKRPTTQGTAKSEVTETRKLAARNTAETTSGDVAVRQNGAQRFAPPPEQSRTVGASRLSGFKLNPVYTGTETNNHSGVSETKNKSVSNTETIPP